MRQVGSSDSRPPKGRSEWRTLVLLTLPAIEVNTGIRIPRPIPGPPDSPMPRVQMDRLASDWFDHHRWIVDDFPDLPGADERSDRVREAIDEKVYADPERVWPIILELIERVPDDHALGYIAAGPLEDLMRFHSARFRDRCAALARTNPRFREALRGVWGWERMPKKTRQLLLPLLADESGGGGFE